MNDVCAAQRATQRPREARSDRVAGAPVVAYYDGYVIEALALGCA